MQKKQGERSRATSKILNISPLQYQYVQGVSHPRFSILEYGPIGEMTFPDDKADTRAPFCATATCIAPAATVNYNSFDLFARKLYSLPYFAFALIFKNATINVTRNESEQTILVFVIFQFFN